MYWALLWKGHHFWYFSHKSHCLILLCSERKTVVISIPPKSLLTSGPQAPVLWTNIVSQPSFLNIVWWQIAGDRHPFPVFFLRTLTYLKAMSKNNNPLLFYTVMDNIVLKMLVSFNILQKCSSLAELQKKTRKVGCNAWNIELSSGFLWVPMNCACCSKLQHRTVLAQTMAFQLWDCSLNWWDAVCGHRMGGLNNKKWSDIFEVVFLLSD